MRDLWQTFKTYLYLVFRTIIKWFLRKTTKLCELQRLCYANNFGAKRTKAVGKCWPLPNICGHT